jgi:hypothetical protein
MIRKFHFVARRTTYEGNTLRGCPDAEHVLGALLLETEWETARAVEAGKDTEQAQQIYIRKLQKIPPGFGLSQ